MKSRARWVAAAGPWLLAWLGGCAAFAERGDYLDYRALRMERDEHAKLLAEQRYAARHPHGHWFEEVQSERRAHDRETFEAGKSTRSGLELYLSAFPDGEFAAQAKSRLSAVAVIERRQLEETQNAARLAEARKREEAELNRTWVTRFVGFWVKSLLSIQQWGMSIEQVAHANPDFSRAFGRAPRPRCTADECVKYYESSYAVPVPGGTRIERSMSLILRLRMDHGVLKRAELLLPARGFSRWREIEERVPVVDGDPDARKQAVDWALARVTPLLDALAPNRTPLADYALAAIAPPAIGSSGELVDTTALDPSSPANRIQGQGEPGSAAAAKPEATVEELVKPQAPEQAPDMELGPLEVGKDGRPLRPAPAPAAPAKPQTPVPDALVPADEEPLLEMAPLSVPGTGAPSQAAPAAPASTPAAPPQPEATPAVPAAVPSLAATTRAFASAGLRLVIFAAASDAKPPAYDALVIEKMTPEPAPRTGKKSDAAGSPVRAKLRAATPAPKTGAAPAAPGTGH